MMIVMIVMMMMMMTMVVMMTMMMIIGKISDDRHKDGGDPSCLKPNYNLLLDIIFMMIIMMSMLAVMSMSIIYVYSPFIGIVKNKNNKSS